MPLNLFLELARLYWKQAFIAVILILWSIGCYNRGREAVKSEWDLANEQAKEEVILIERKNNEITNKIGNDYEKRKADIDAAFNAAIDSMFATTDGNLPPKANSAIGINAITCTNAISKANARKLVALAKEAEINTQKLISLQEWVLETY